MRENNFFFHKDVSFHVIFKEKLKFLICPTIEELELGYSNSRHFNNFFSLAFRL